MSAMAQASQYSFELVDVVTALIKENGVHEGKWVAGIEFNFGAIYTGPSQDAVRPAGAVAVNRFMITRVVEGQEPAPPPQLVVDAAEVNPAPKPAGTVKSRSKSKVPA